MKIQYFLLIFFIVLQFICVFGFNQNRIRNGILAQPNWFKNVIQIQSNKGKCSATIISNRHLLTAANCVRDARVVEERPNFKIIYHYAVFQIDGNTDSSVNVPLEYPKHHGTDIAVVEFPEDMKFGVEPVKLAKDYIEKDGEEVTIVGYGRWTDSKGVIQRGDSNIRYANVSISGEPYGSYQIWYGNDTHKNLQGDSGGPIFIYRNNQWYQIGIHSSAGGRGYGTRIASFCNFIEATTKQKVQCQSIFPDRKPLPIFDPIYQGPESQPNLFNFVVPLYVFSYSEGCTATVISKRHLLTSANCIYKDGNLTLDHQNYKTISHTFFADFLSKNLKTNADAPIEILAYFPKEYHSPIDQNIAIIEYPDGIDFGIEPVALAKDYFYVYLEKVIIAGYGKYEINERMRLDGSSAPPLKDMKVSTIIVQDYWTRQGSDLWLEKNDLIGDEGGPALIERNGKFYQIGISSYAFDDKDYRTRVQKYCNFIENVTQNEVKCESILESPK